MPDSKIELPVIRSSADELGTKVLGPAAEHDPWAAFSLTHRRGERLTSSISRIVHDIGVFVALEGGIDGIVHLGDLGWNASDRGLGQFSVGDVIEVVILSIDVGRQRVSLRIKQLGPDPRARGWEP